MATVRGLFVRAITVGASRVGTTPVQARQDIAGLIASPTATFGARPGVISGCTVSGSVTGWNYSVAAGHLVTSRSAGDGALPWAIDGATLVATSAAPVSGSRIDIVYASHNDVDNGDANNDPVLGVVSGAAAGTPIAPSIPAGTIELGRATLPSGAANTQGATFSAANVQYTAPRGAPIPVTGTTQRNALTASASPSNPIEVDRLDTGARERSVGTTWDMGGFWADYVPVLGASTTDPTLGSGSSTDGRYTKMGRTVTGWASFTFGTTGMSPGSGTWSITAPLASYADGANKVVGEAYMVDASDSSRRRLGVVLLASGASTFTFASEASVAAVNPTTPFTWAASDIIRINFRYESAS